MNKISNLNQSIAGIERSRANLIETINGMQLDADTLGKLASADELIAKAEHDLNEIVVDMAMATRQGRNF